MNEIPTSNVERPTSNIEFAAPGEPDLPDSMFDAERSMFDVRLGFQLLTILLCGLFVYGFRLGGSPLDRTEPFRALVAHQMVKSGDWLIPRLYGEVYLRKPPLIYWIEAGTEKLMGRGDEFVWRLPSMLGSALLAVFVAWWSGRWFGRRAVLPAGFACLALIALWDQDRGADIDALNTAFAVVTSLCGLELVCGDWVNRQDTENVGKPKKISRAGWCLVMGLSLGATLLLKGPGGLPQAIGALAGPAILFRNWKPLRRPAIVVGLVIGLGLFLTYAVLAKVEMHRAGIAGDRTGIYEVIDKVFLHGWKRRVVALLIPVELLLFAMPVSAALPFAITIARGLPKEDIRRKRVLALLATLVATLAIWMLDGNDNPRYEYVMLPLLAPLAGFVWASWDRSKIGFYSTLLGLALLMCGVALGITMKLPGAGKDHAAIDHTMILAAIVSAAAALTMLILFWKFRSSFARLSGPLLVLLLLCVAVPMGERKNLERRRKSSKNAAAQLRGVIGDATRVSATSLVRDLPELFYYAGLDVDSYGESGLPELAKASGGRWVILSETPNNPAYSTLGNQIPGSFPKGATHLKMPDPRDQIYVGWYDPPAGADTHIKWNAAKAVESED